MKKFLTLLIILGLCSVCYIYKNEISSFIVDLVIDIKKEPSNLVNNKYASNTNYAFVSLTDDFEPNSKQDIINIYYTILNSGMTNFTFYCPNSSEYENCINDIDYISNNQKLLSDINNFIPVYNSFSNIETEFDTLGKVDIRITHTYDDNTIKELETIIDDTITKNITSDNITDDEKIKLIHDYIINNTKYDVDRSDNKITTYKSDTAYGTLVEHYAICSGYADSMKLFLDKLNIKNYKISSENHVWNLVYLNNNWYHLDLTWDDPVTSTGEDVLEYDYFLITSDDLKKLETDQHIFDSEIYKEAVSLPVN